jgi:DNA polymerase-3 subunit beta
MVTIERAALTGALTALNRIVERRNVIPILSHVLISVDGERAAITATDLDVVATARVAATGDALAFAAPADTLRQIIARAPGEDVTLETVDDGARALVRSGRMRTHINVLPGADFPQWEARDYDGRIEMSGAELADMLDRCTPAIPTGKAADARTYLAGVYLHDEGADLVGVATDGARLHRAIVSGAAGALATGIILPDKVARLLPGLVKDVAQLTLEVSASTVRLTAGGITIASKLVDGTYPDYRRVIPQWRETVATLSRPQILEAAARAALCAHRGVSLAFDGEAVTVSASNADVGDHEETVEIDYAGDPVTIGIQGKFIADGLGALTGDRIEASIADAGSPALFASVGDRERLVVLMPVRL